MEDDELGAAQPRPEERQGEQDPIDALSDRIDEETRIVDDEPAEPREDRGMGPIFRQRWLMHRLD